MFPAQRTEGEGFSSPQFELPPRAVDGLLDALPAFHDQCRGGVSRSAPREPFFNYLVGPCSAGNANPLRPWPSTSTGATCGACSAS